MGGPSLSIGGAQLGLGMDVFDHRALEPSTAVSLELRLAWPSGGGTTEVPGLRPYAAFGPALFVLEPTDAVLPWRAGDPSVALGVKGALGLSWRLDPGSAVFGEYRVTRGVADRLLPASHGGDIGGHDLLYGVRFRF